MEVFKISMNINNTHLDEFYELQEKFLKITEDKEKRQKDFFKHSYLKDYKSNETYKMGFNLESWYTKQGQSSLQKILYNKSISKDLGLSVSFMTFTLPSKFHKYLTTETVYDTKQKKYVRKPLKFDKWKINPKFGFKTIEESLEEGYKFLSKIWRYFYISVKKNKKHKKKLENLKYDLVHEFHKTYQNHIHILMYHDKDLNDFIYEEWEKVIKKFDMNIKGQDIKQDFKKVDFGVNYILKYITKTLFINQKNIVVNGVEIEQDKENIVPDDEKRSYIEKFNGWKTVLGRHSRIHKSSNSKIGIGNYRKIYHNMSDKDKEVLLKRSKDNNTCLLYEVEKVTYKETHILDEKEKRVKKFNEDIKDKCMFKVYIQKEVVRKQKIDIDNPNIKRYINKNDYERKKHIDKKLRDKYETIKNDTLKQLHKDIEDEIYISYVFDRDNEIYELSEEIHEMNNFDNDSFLILTYKVNNLVVLNEKNSEIYNKNWFKMIKK